MSKKKQTKNTKNTENTNSDNYTHIAIVLDRSGSMNTTRSATINGFNEWLNGQQALEGRATLTMAQFDNEYEILHSNVDIKSVGELNNETFVPRGSTALLDAIGRTIHETEHHIDEMETEPDKVLFVIITDGGENTSHEFVRDQIFEMINRHRKENSWEFVFIGANQDAIQTGGGYGVRSGSAMTYGASDSGAKSMFRSLDIATTSFRTKSKAATNDKDFKFFSDKDRKDQEEELDKKSNKLGALGIGKTKNSLLVDQK